MFLKKVAESLMAAYDIKVLTLSCDITKEDAADIIYNFCSEKKISVNTLINNAGMAKFGEFAKIDIEKQLTMIDLNIKAVISLTYRFLPDLLKLPKGVIINVASTAALYPLPYYSIYGATKAFVLSFTEALRFEYRNSNLDIRCLCPGDTDTEFFNKAGNIYKKQPTQSPELVADTLVKMLQKKKPLIFPGQAKMISRMPKWLIRRIVSKRCANYKKP
jgi:short-subunit dehydrogenase